MFNIEFSVLYCEFAVHDKYAVVIEFLLDYVQYLFLSDRSHRSEMANCPICISTDFLYFDVKRQNLASRISEFQFLIGIATVLLESGQSCPEFHRSRT
jgi:hypothetical protein